MYHASNRKTTNAILAIMIVGILAVITLSLVTGRYDTVTHAGTSIFGGFGGGK